MAALSEALSSAPSGVRSAKDRFRYQINCQNERDPSEVAADGVLELAGGIFAADVANPAAGVFSNGTVGLAAVVPCLFIVSFSVGGALPAGGTGVST
jgi:hypothetical protein